MRAVILDGHPGKNHLEEILLEENGTLSCPQDQHKKENRARRTRGLLKWTGRKNHFHPSKHYPRACTPWVPRHATTIS